MTIKPKEILDFWFVATPASKRYVVDPDLDAKIQERFLGTWRQARAGRLQDWEEDAKGALALIILFDQFSRNMFRGSGEAFSCDALALEIAKRSVARGFVGRQFGGHFTVFEPFGVGVHEDFVNAIGSSDSDSG